MVLHFIVFSWREKAAGEFLFRAVYNFAETKHFYHADFCRSCCRLNFAAFPRPSTDQTAIFLGGEEEEEERGGDKVVLNLQRYTMFIYFIAQISSVIYINR